VSSEPSGHRRLLVAGVLGIGLLTVMPSAGAASGDGPDDRRVIVLSVPGLTWKDVDPAILPTLDAFVEEAAIANLATRVTRPVSAPAEAYLTLGTGTRAVAPELLITGSYDADEAFGAGTAGDEHAREQGAGSSDEVITVSWTELEAANDAAEFDATLGGLGDLLAAAKVDRGVIANADGSDPLVPDEPLHREAALALADHTGAVPCGLVGRRLLQEAPSAPFGVRLDEEAVARALTRCSTSRSVVLVEASDLRRAEAFADRATADQADAARRAALIGADNLLAGVLEQVDLAQDAVVVVAPTTDPDAGLGVLAIRSPEHGRGLLTSGNTRRAGYVLLTDLAPSIGRLAGVAMDEASIEGRVAEVRRSDRSSAQLRADLVDGEAAALFRDRMVEPIVLLVVFLTSVLALVGAVALLREWSKPLAWAARSGLVLLALPSLTYLAALLPFHEWGSLSYVGFVGVGALAVAVACSLLARTWPMRLALVYGLLALVVTASVVLLGSRLQVSTVFGDSPIVAGRFLGINNVTFAFLMTAASMLALLAVHRHPGPTGRRIMVAVLAAALLVDVAPMWGADVGGALAGLPALVVLGIGLGRWQVRWRTLLLAVVATVVLIGLLGALDLSRPAADRSHLGRLFERIGSDGSSGLTTVMERKLSANLRSLTQSAWRYLFGPLAIAAGLVVWRAPERLQAAAGAVPSLGRAVPGLLALAVLGYALNDSGIAVPGAMLASLAPGLIVLLWWARSSEAVA
jgi:hypothetical protein